MRIGIIGGGSIGLLCAAYLAEKHDVTLFTHRKSQADMIRENGLFFDNKPHKRIQVHAIELQHAIQLEGLDLVFVTVKQYDLKALLPTIKSVNSTFVFLQNGIMKKELMIEFKGKIVFGIVSHGAQRMAGNIIRHNGIGKIILDAILSSQFQVADLSVEDFPFETTNDIQSRILDKLIVNAIINPITAIYRVKNGELIHNEELINLKNQLAQEIFQILKIEQLETQRKALEFIDQICQRTAENKSSMLQDIEQGRQTEVDSILGYLSDQAVEVKVTAPLVNECYRRVKDLSKDNKKS
ncbi:MAG: 2-dehydropantoate 2-reductase [Bacillales bacterium]|jgi:2-dehydropantoate 2-reductase|nr:2-dehydropantoate 2-reductase [Bacillales bacterium]